MSDTFYWSIASPMLTVFVAVLAIKHQISINRRNKRIDIIAGCNSRYDAIYDLRLQAEEGKFTKPKAHAYYGRFWGLKSDQFDYWLAGFVDIETFTDWCFMTVKAFRENNTITVICRESKKENEIEKLKFLSFDYGWMNVGVSDHNVTNAWFTELTCALRELGQIWDYENKQPSNKQNHKNIREELRIIIYIILVKSDTYRKYLSYNLTQDQYENSAKEFKTLGLMEENRNAAISQIKKKWIYWKIRLLPLIGPIFARIRPIKSDNLISFSVQNVASMKASKN